ncbi:MAG: nitroreductase family protein [Pseudomonadota bacterium]
MNALTALQTRTASPRLIEPAPADAALDQILKAGLRAPDHGMLRPWRFLVVEGEARRKLGELFVNCLQPQTPEQKAKLLDSPMRAPMIIVCVATIKDHPKVPAIEQICSAAAAVQNMAVAIHALNFGAIWKTGEVAYNPAVKAALGLSPTDAIVGYLYVGTPTTRERVVPELKITDFVQHWQG